VSPKDKSVSEHTKSLPNKSKTAKMMNNPYNPFNDNVAQSSPSSEEEKLFPSFARVMSSADSANPCQYRSSQTLDDNEDLDRKPAAKNPPPAMPAGVSSSDVLCGRDKQSHAHVGNKHFRRIIETHREDYQNAQCRDQKTNITCQVIETIHSIGGRFLKLNENSGLWEEVSEPYAREKVSHALRSAKDPNRPKVKKPRKTKQYVPTAEEDIQFEHALKTQKEIFQTLLANHVDSDGDQDTDRDADNECGDDDQGEDDWDFYQ
jgi:hypothetical protein